MNCNIPYPLSFILLTELVCERRDLLRLEKRIETLARAVLSVSSFLCPTDARQT